MKKNDALIAIGAIIFAILFYEQAFGINYLIFTLMYGLLNILFNKEKLSGTWYFAFSLHFLCAFNIFHVNTFLSIFAWICSLFYVVGQTFEAKNSAIITSFFSIASPITSFGIMCTKLFTVNTETTKQPKIMYLGAILVSFILVLIFFFLYKGANPLFDNFTDNIDFSWINSYFIFFCFIGFYVLFILIYPYTNSNISIWDKNKLQELKIEDEDQNSVSKKFVGLIAILVFISLNVMLLSLNILDIRSVFMLEKLPENVFLSDFLHIAVSNIIFSIVFAILLIVGVQQFKIKNNFIKILIYAWIAQSVIMIINAFIRNYWYSFDQITYLRIGVFIFLGLCIFGLIYTAYSIFKKRNYWFLLNLNMQTWLFVLVFMSLFSWDRIITKHNLKFEKIEEIDLAYLSSLSENNVDLMLEFYHKHPQLFDNYEYYNTLLDELKWKKHSFVRKMQHQTWQSFNLSDQMKYKNLKTLKNNSKSH